MIDFVYVPAHWEFIDQGFKDWLYACAHHWGARIAQLQYHFLNNQDIMVANCQYLGHDYVTDVITFPYAQGKLVKAECLIGFERVEEQAQAGGLSLPDEAARVMVHGLLHCLGWDDQSQEQKREMRAAEDYCLLLRAKNL